MPSRYDFVMPVSMHEIAGEHYAPATNFRLLPLCRQTPPKVGDVPKLYHSTFIMPLSEITVKNIYPKNFG